MIHLAILDDYQNVSLEMADWSPLAGRAVITVFNDHLSNFDKVVERLLPFDVVCVMRERTPLSRSVIGRLPRLKLIASTGPRNAAIDVEAAAERGIVVAHTRYDARPTIEMTWALILASARQAALENANPRAGGWQLTMGDSLRGKTLGVLGLGNIGSEVARAGLAFGMEVIAWSQNLTADKAQTCGARLVSKEELFRSADSLTIHLVLSQRTRGLVGAAELQAMKPSARLINTSRGPIVDEPALIEATCFLRELYLAMHLIDIETARFEHKLPVPNSGDLRGPTRSPRLIRSQVGRVADDPGPSVKEQIERTPIMSQRMNYNAASPAGMKALGAVNGYVRQSGLPSRLVDLVFLRVSQINGCAYCIDMHSRDLLKTGLSSTSSSSPHGPRSAASSTTRKERRSRGRKS